MRVDYKRHQTAFLIALKSEPSLTVREYCESEGLKYETARRYLKRPRNDKKLAEAKLSKEKVPEARKPTCEPKIQPKVNKAGTDWHSLLKEFLVRATKNPALTMKAFAEEKGKPVASVRRTFKGLRNAQEFGQLWDLYDAQSAQYNAIKRASAQPDRAVRRGKASSNNRGATAQVIATAQGEEESAQQGSFFDHAQSGGSVRYHSSKIGAPIIHGGYARSVTLDNEIMEVLMSIDPLSVANELVMARAQYYRMQQRLSGALSLVDEQEANDELPTDAEDNPLDPNRLRDQLIFGYAPRLRELEQSISTMVKNEQRRYENLRKIEFEEANRAYLLPAEEAALVMEMLHLRSKRNWSAVETCRQIELLGATPPAMLFHEAKVELASLEPEIDDSGVSEEELDAQFISYSDEQSEFGNAWLEDRRNTVSELILEAEARENGELTELSAKEVQKAAEAEKQYDELAERERQQPSVFDDLDDFESLGVL